MKKKLLLADDSITIQKVIAITFSSDDYALTVVDNGDAAVEKARAERPDLILADVFMPGKNGYEVCAAVKQDPNLQGVPVLLLTGTFEPFDEAKAKAVGAEKWISKPFESQTLIDCVETLLAQSPAVVAPAPAVAAAPPRVAAPAPPRAVAPAPPAPPEAVEEDDLWGDFSETQVVSFEPAKNEKAGADFEPASAVASDDLWGTVSFEEEELGGAEEFETVEDDGWGSFEDEVTSPPPATIALGSAAAPKDEAVADDLWGSLDEELAPAAPQQAAVIPPETLWEDEGDLLPLEDVEILGEEDLELETLAFEEEEILGAPPAAPAPEEFDGDNALIAGEVLWEDEPEDLPMETSGSMVDSGWDMGEETTLGEWGQGDLAVEPPPAVTPVAKAPPAAAPAKTPAPTEERVAALSEAELERVVEKVAGAVIERLAHTLLEKIAWEVVPDLAEALVREEIRKIKEAV